MQRIILDELSVLVTLPLVENAERLLCTRISKMKYIREITFYNTSETAEFNYL